MLLGARDPKRGQEAAQQLKVKGLDARFVLLEPTDAEPVKAAALAVEAEYGKLDVLVNNAGVLIEADHVAPTQVPTLMLRDTHSINVLGVHEVTCAF